MEKLEYNTVIKFFVLYGLTPKESHPKFIRVHEDSASSISTVKRWAPEFKRGRTLALYGAVVSRPKGDLFRVGTGLTFTTKGKKREIIRDRKPK
jgi:hypothetical protein